MTMEADSRSVRLRDATPTDLQALAQLHVRTFNEMHGPGPDYAIREHQWRSAFQSQDGFWFCIVLETDAGDLVGFAKGIPHSDAELSGFGGELNKIYLLREYHRKGLGRRLLCAAAQRFLKRGITSMLLFGNASSPTNGFYEAMGAERLHASTGEFHGGYGWRNLEALAARCAEAQPG